MRFYFLGTNLFTILFSKNKVREITVKGKNLSLKKWFHAQKKSEKLPHALQKANTWTFYVQPSF